MLFFYLFFVNEVQYPCLENTKFVPHAPHLPWTPREHPILGQRRAVMDIRGNAFRSMHNWHSVPKLNNVGSSFFELLKITQVTFLGHSVHVNLMYTIHSSTSRNLSTTHPVHLVMYTRSMYTISCHTAESVSRTYKNTANGCQQINHMQLLQLKYLT